ncbi:lytic transglycosylase domain-containing protein [Gordonia sp. (in: high G+C Gram-positive bacteria)]|uniref:lytic transglycosylase domain-containing protein n=1 Tax=Gordonia sp. (in: high G+C Gram-positive bacteria) TaxID=84139 RepID=UPI00168FA94A|nr:lytic transglycosylase domain-containing protein [Gordonia sp. (in: high G+C Gram-positive bacteria)]NLG45891.1 lytic transglycosylase domain-containing protein [Gordonia sp. (in: high G+C Gram-positive bacteria)]
MGMRFRGDNPKRVRVTRRGLAAGTTAAALGAMVLGGTVSSVAPQHSALPTSTSQSSVDLAGDRTALAAAEVANTVPSNAAQLVGFAPPADPSIVDGAAQFRLAANLPAGPLGIPGIVLKAYKLSAKRVAAETPQCKLPWYLLAGIGRIESGHAGNGNVDVFGNTRTSIRGPVLDGSLAGNAVITDNDGGKLDGDARHDRAMGPMQFIPSTWASWGSDGNGDGKANPDNIFDATFSAGRYLCSGVTDIMAAPTRVNNILRYNRSVAYANNVLGWAAAYAAGVMPTTPIPEMSAGEPEKNDKDKDKPKRDRKDERPDATTGPSSQKPSTPPSKTKPKPPSNCIGPICLPPGVGPAPQPSPKAKPQSKSTPNRPAASKPAEPR